MSEFRSGNRLVLLDSGRDYFPALLAALAAAKKEIYLETYIFANDVTGQAVAQALKAAAQRGVRTHVTVDGFGARNFKADYQSALEAAGVRVWVYRPELARFRLRRHRLRRLHRKLAVIDGRIAFVGGINVIDDDNAPAEMVPRYDYAVHVEGPVLRDIHRAARRLVELLSWASFRRRPKADTGPLETPLPCGDQSAAFLLRDNLRHRHDILNAYLAAIMQSTSDILIANAYFLPGLRFEKALQAAARRGVRIVIVLQGKTDHPFLRFATQALYRRLLESGIRIFEYQKSVMHAKVAVVDGLWATVGSSNIDPFSLFLAKEANLVVRDSAFAQSLSERIWGAIAEGAQEMHLSTLAEQSWWLRQWRRFCYGVVRVLVGMTGYGAKPEDPSG